MFRLQGMTKKARPEEIYRWLTYREAHGLTYAELATRAGVSMSTVFRWTRQAKVQRETDRSAFAQVAIPEDPNRIGIDSGITLRVGAVAIEVQAGFDAALLRQILATLQNPPC